MVKMGHKKKEKKHNLKMSIKKVKMKLIRGGILLWKGGGGTKIRFGLRGGHMPAVPPWTRH